MVFGGKLLGWGTGFFFLPEGESSMEDSLESDTFNLGLGTGTKNLKKVKTLKCWNYNLVKTKRGWAERDFIRISGKDAMSNC